MEEFLFGLWNGLTMGFIFWLHVFGAAREYPFYDSARSSVSGWYDFGFLLSCSSGPAAFIRAFVRAW